MRYPLRFEPIFREYLWGGRRLATDLGKPLGNAQRYAESWEVVDRAEAQSIVAAGPAAGRTLNELVSDYAQELLGPAHTQYDRFPLLFKFLDCNRNLSVQVHPNDAQAAMLDPPDLGKTEAWYVLAAEPGATIFVGLKEGIDREALQRAVEHSTMEECLHRVEAKVGDCIFVPAGTVHALGAGLLVAEIQQSSDTTYRLFDWNRVDAEGNARELHVGAALEVIDYDRGEVSPQPPQATDGDCRHRLVVSDKFVLDRLSFSGQQSIGGDDRAHLLAVVAGEMTIEGDACDEPATRGTTALVPACCGQVNLTTAAEAQVLDIYLP